MKYLRDEEGIKKFGLHLKRLRIDRKISQEELAYKSGLEFSQVSRIERGIINTSISHVFALAKALELEAYDLFKFDKD